MLDIHVPRSSEHNMTNASRLVTGLTNLYSFDQIAGWDSSATAEVASIQVTLSSLEPKQQALSRALEQEKRDHQAKSFFVRLFANRQERTRLLGEQTRLANEKAQLELFLSQLETAIDFTPNSADDLAEMLREFKQRKKELQSEKKALDAQMASIRVEARQRTVDTIPGKYGTWDRRNIRLQKEAALQPHESDKAAVVRQIVYLDRMITWLERFKSN